MVKFMVFMSRRADVSLEVFKRHYEEIHAPLSLQHMTFPGYVRNHVVEMPGMPRPDFDVVTAFWYKDEAHLRRTLDLLKSDLRFLGEDGDLFIDRSKTWNVAVEERYSDLPGSSPGMVKFMALLKRKAGLSREEFIDHYEAVHAPLILRLSTGVEQYARNFTLPGRDGAEPPYDSVTELWYRDRDALRASMATWRSEAGNAIREDEEKLLDRERIVAFLADERVSIAQHRGNPHAKPA